MRAFAWSQGHIYRACATARGGLCAHTEIVVVVVVVFVVVVFVVDVVWGALKAS